MRVIFEDDNIQVVTPNGVSMILRHKKIQRAEMTIVWENDFIMASVSRIGETKISLDGTRSPYTMLVEKA